MARWNIFQNININSSFFTTKSITSSILTGITLYICGKIIKKCYLNNFAYIEIPLKRNLALSPKIQSYLSTNSYFGKRTILENGKSFIKTGYILTLFPAIAIYSIKMNKKINEDSNLINDKIGIYLISNKYTVKQYIDFLRNIVCKDRLIKVYNLANNSNQWNFCKYIERYPQPDYYPDYVISKIESEIDLFIKSRDLYISKGKNYKKSFLFYGPTGSGKTSMVKHLAIKYGRNIHLINPDDFFKSNDIIYSVLKSCEGGIILLEHIDKFLKSLFEKEEHADISKLLTLLDGFYTPEDSIIIMTADYTGDLPDDLVRDGRLDSIIRFPYITSNSNEVVTKICNNYFFNKDNIKINGNITTSLLIKNIEDATKQSIESSNPLIIEDIKPTVRSSFTNILSVINNQVELNESDHGVNQFTFKNKVNMSPSNFTNI